MGGSYNSDMVAKEMLKEESPESFARGYIYVKMILKADFEDKTKKKDLYHQVIKIIWCLDALKILST